MRVTEVAMLIVQTRVQCPYCGQDFVTVVDTSDGDQRYIEDCQICCHPIVLRIQTDDNLNLIGLSAERENE
jgi:transposase-like protein